jgi:hypothetical protein
MTPKEKAKELVSIYWGTKIETPHVREYIMSKELAKQCAIIAVDEILNNFGLISESYIFYTSSSTRSFYEDVKKEIEKL